MKNNILLTLFAAAFILFIYLIKNLDNNNHLIIEEIHNGYEGTIIRKVAVPKDLFTHLQVHLAKNKDTLVFFGDVEKVKIGDKISKLKDSPFCLINDTTKFIYTLIPEKILLDKNFPDVWRVKCKGEWSEAMVRSSSAGK